MKRQKRLALAIGLALAAWGSASYAASGAQIDASIDKALAYLSGAQNAATGYWAYGGFEPAATGGAAFAMLSQQATNLLGSDGHCSGDECRQGCNTEGGKRMAVLRDSFT